MGVQKEDSTLPKVHNHIALINDGLNNEALPITPIDIKEKDTNDTIVEKDLDGGFCNPLSTEISSDLPKDLEAEGQAEGTPANNDPEKPFINLGYVTVVSGKTILPSFKWKVLGTLLVQLIIGMSFFVVLYVNKATLLSFNFYVEVSLLVFIVLLSLLHFISKLKPATLTNLGICVVFITLGHSWMAAYYAIQLKHYEEVYFSLLMSGTVTCCLMFYSSRLKLDITTWIFRLYPIYIALLVHWVFAVTAELDAMVVVLSGFGLLMSSFYIMCVTQLITGGRLLHFSVSPHSYLFASMKLYLWIMIHFIFAMTLIGLKKLRY